MLLNITPRKYQQEILETCREKSCLVVLPTGIGKTLIALMLTIERMKKFPEEKVLFLAPTRPLTEQHLEYFKKHLPELWATMELFTGKTDAGKRKKLWQNADIIFSTPQCIDGETLIFTEEGPIKISDFFKKFKFGKKEYNCTKGEIADINEKILGFDGKAIKFLNASKAWKLSGNGLIKIRTEIGNNLLCTRDHPLLTINPIGEMSWKEASQLKENEYIASAKEINLEKKPVSLLQILSNNASLKIADKLLIKRLIEKLKERKIKTSKYSRYLYNFMPAKLFLELSKEVDFNYDALSLTDACGRSSPVRIPEQITPKLAYIIGAMLGDGHIGNRKSHGGEVIFSDLDRESVSSYFKESIKNIFGVEMKKDKIKGLVAYNSALASTLISLGIPAGNKSGIIRVPSFLFFSGTEVAKGFIKGIFDTDGNASKYGVSISSVSERFIQDLKWLFLMMGIVGNIEKRKNKGIIQGREIRESEIFTFRFCGRRNLEKFLEICPNEQKCRILKETLKNTKKPNTRSKEILPIPELMKKIRKANNSKADYYKFSCLSLDNLKKLSKNLEGKDALKLKELLGLPIRWVKIKEKQEIVEDKKVYDLTIEKHHNFIANSIINHNCIGNDVKNNLYSLENVSLLIEDECHRCMKNYAYTYVAKKYKEQAKHPHVLGLTASPGSEKAKIKQILENLGIEAVEIRTRESEDVKEYLQELTFEIVKLDFPPQFDEIRVLLKKVHDKKVLELKSRKLLFMPPTKKFLLECQHKIMRSIASGNKHFNLLLGASACAIAIKLQHALELLETQTLSSFNAYLQSLYDQAAKKESKAVQRLVASPEFSQACIKTQELISKKIEHPKLIKLKEIIQEELSQNPRLKIIVFAQFRETLLKISKTLNEIPKINAKIFVGQAIKTNKKGEVTGLSQREQREIIQEFTLGQVNILCASSIGEEGLDIPEVNAVIFYEPVPSEIRKIQRAGRTARLMEGKLIMLITKATRDEAYYWAAFSKEKKMHSAISSLKEEFKNKDILKPNNQEKLF
ncbi:MAG: DEAD/DEAH box helicase family protein [Nanoarchaeota archaeon]|nr:DEAD/DEAH box helicase family protein [Nanoarchaeota archaeon]